MNTHTESHNPADADRLAQLVAQMLASHAAWRANATTVARLHRRWCEAPPGDQAGWYSRYVAALDQEEAAAVVYELDAWDLEDCLQRADGSYRAVTPSNASRY